MSKTDQENMHQVIIKGLEIAAKKAKAEHKRNNRPIVVSINDEVIKIPPEDIHLD